MRIPLKLKHLKLIFSLLVLALFTFKIYEGYQAPNYYWSISRHGTGDLAWLLFLFIIFSSLFSKLIRKCQILKQLLPLRKEAGILIFIIALFHGISHLVVSEANTISQINKTLFENLGVIFGSTSLLIMLPLFLTSNNYSIKKLNGKNWKLLHKLTHLSFILVVFHIAFINYPYTETINLKPFIPFSLYILGYGYLSLKKLNSKKND